MTLRPTDIDYTAAVVPERMWTGGSWLEGPCWLPVEQRLLFSDVAASAQYTLDPETKEVTLFRSCSNYGNGNTLDPVAANRARYYGFYPPELQDEADYVVVTCEHGRRCVSASLPPHAMERYLAKRGPGAGLGLRRPREGEGEGEGSRQRTDGRTEATAHVPPYLFITNKVLTEKFIKDMRYNSPNDVVVREQDGSIWFTDPSYGIHGNTEGYTAPSQINHCFVFAIYPPHLCTVVRRTRADGGTSTKGDTSGSVNANCRSRHHPAMHAVRIQVQDAVRPNGLAFSPDGAKLYVADSCREDFAGLAGRPEIRVYDVRPAEADVEETREVTDKAGAVVETVTLRYRPLVVSGGRTFCEVSPGFPDGFRIDGNGYVFTSSEHAIIVYTPEGEEVRRVDLPERTSNCSFGGPHGRDLYVTANSSIYRLAFPAKAAQAK